MMRVKICGTVHPDDARQASRLGADAVGVLVGMRHKAEDAVSLERAKDIFAALEPFTTPVIVTHEIEAHAVARLVEALHVRTVQLHDDISPEQIEILKMRFPFGRWIKAIGVPGDDLERRMASYIPLVDAFVLDSHEAAEDRIGGTGKTHDWSISRNLVKFSQVPVILAGGLRPSNLERAIRQVRPWGVDVNSGVEPNHGNRDGRKDLKKLENFLRIAKSET